MRKEGKKETFCVQKRQLKFRNLKAKCVNVIIELKGKWNETARPFKLVQRRHHGVDNFEEQQQQWQPRQHQRPSPHQQQQQQHWTQVNRNWVSIDTESWATPEPEGGWTGRPEQIRTRMFCHRMSSWSIECTAFLSLVIKVLEFYGNWESVFGSAEILSYSWTVVFYGTQRTL